jgi:hypothetical protein
MENRKRNFQCLEKQALQEFGWVGTGSSPSRGPRRVPTPLAGGPRAGTLRSRGDRVPSLLPAVARALGGSRSQWDHALRDPLGGGDGGRALWPLVNRAVRWGSPLAMGPCTETLRRRSILRHPRGGRTSNRRQFYLLNSSVRRTRVARE